MAFVLQSPEVFTVARLRQVAMQAVEIQDEYLESLKIHKMSRENINKLKTNLHIIDANILQQNNLRVKVLDMITELER